MALPRTRAEWLTAFSTPWLPLASIVIEQFQRADCPRVCGDEAAAVELMEQQRWGDERCCLHCGWPDVYQMRDRTSGERNKRFLWRCRRCNGQYTVRLGTVMESSQVPLRHWCYVFWAACTNEEGVSAKQIRDATGVSHKTALFMIRRIRSVMNRLAAITTD